MATRGGQKRSAVPRDNVFHLKLVLLGAVAVGKTKLALRFAKGEFTEHYEVTIGAFYTKTVVNLDGMTVKFEIWDTAGQERFRSLAPMYYRGAQAAIVVYDITNADSFVRAQSWVRELQRETGPDIVIALAGNKVDLSRERVVHSEEAQTFADTNGLLFRETSAKTAKNVNDMFMAIAKKVPKRHTSGLQRPTTKTKEPYVSNRDPKHKPAPSGNCCK